ncbi:MAG: hypothetical protein SOX84_02855, partial [Prevotella sp.]|nr:hypothetical protein [Prevotella sp.]MDY4217706.1 hypothetical protein [Prevotella sp.]
KRQMHHQKNLIYLIRGLGFQKRMRNYLYKGNSARIYRIFKFYRTAIIKKQVLVGVLIGYSLENAGRVSI